MTCVIRIFSYKFVFFFLSSLIAVAYAQIDWHDFVVVETVDYQPFETGNFPPPTTATEVGARVLMEVSDILVYFICALFQIVVSLHQFKGTHVRGGW